MLVVENKHDHDKNRNKHGQKKMNIWIVCRTTSHQLFYLSMHQSQYPWSHTKLVGPCIHTIYVCASIYLFTDFMVLFHKNLWQSKLELSFSFYFLFSFFHFPRALSGAARGEIGWGGINFLLFYRASAFKLSFQTWKANVGDIRKSLLLLDAGKSWGYS